MVPPESIIVRSLKPIVERLVALSNGKVRRRLVLIGGCSQAGKTTLAQDLVARCRDHQIPAVSLSLDRWIVDVRDRAPSMTVLERFEIPKIIESVRSLLEGKVIYPPQYDPITRQRLSETSEPISLPSGLFVVDGVIALAIPELREISHLNLYVEVADPVRIKRLQRLYSVVKGLPAEATHMILQEREGEETPLVRETRRWAHFVVPGDSV